MEPSHEECRDWTGRRKRQGCNGKCYPEFLKWTQVVQGQSSRDERQEAKHASEEKRIAKCLHPARTRSDVFPHENIN